MWGQRELLCFAMMAAPGVGVVVKPRLERPDRAVRISLPVGFGPTKRESLSRKPDGVKPQVSSRRPTDHRPR
jgi:hypothetical protein